MKFCIHCLKVGIDKKICWLFQSFNHSIPATITIYSRVEPPSRYVLQYSIVCMSKHGPWNDITKIQPHFFQIIHYWPKTSPKQASNAFKYTSIYTLKITTRVGTIVDQKRVLKQAGVVQEINSVVFLLCMPYQKGIHSIDANSSVNSFSSNII